MGVNHCTQGRRNGQRDQQSRAAHRATSAAPGASPFSITGQCNAMGTREAGFTSSLPGYRKFENAADRADLAAIWNVPIERDSRPHAAWPIPTSSKPRSTARSARSGSSRRIRSCRSRTRRAAAGARESRLSGRAGRLSSDADDGTGRSRAAGRDLGREGRHLHELRTARQQGEQARSSRRARRDRTSTSSSTSPSGSAAATSCFPAGRRREDAFEEWRRVSTGRLCDYSGMTYELIERARRLAVAVSRGRDRLRRTRLYADGSSRPTTARRGCPRRVGAVPGAADTRVSVCAEHRPDGRALAHAHQDRAGADSRASLAAAPGSR